MDFQDNLSQYSNQSNQKSRKQLRKGYSKEKLPELSGRLTPGQLDQKTPLSRNMLRSLNDNKNAFENNNSQKFGKRPSVQNLKQDNLMSREVDKEISSLQMNQRMRELESMVLDFKGNIERRISNYFSENPATLKQQFKSMEDKEQNLWTENFQKQNLIQEQYQNISQQLRKTSDINSQQILQMQKKIDEMDFKNHRLEKAMEGVIMKMKTNTDFQSKALAIQGPQDQIQYKNANKGDDFGLVREHINQELKSWENQVAELSKNYKELNERMFRNEKEIYSKLMKQKEDITYENKTTKKQIQELDSLKMEKLLGENDYLKNLIAGLERRIDDELDKRLKSEYENKGYLEQKMIHFKEEIRNDEKQILQNEQNFVEKFHESINSINQIVKFTREELEANLASTQTLFSENVRNLNRTLEIVKENMYTKVSTIEKNEKELNMRMNEVKQQFHQHAQTVNNQFDTQNDRIEELNNNLKTILTDDLKSQNSRIQKYQSDNEEWQDQFEKKNLQIFSEVSNALKGLKADINKHKVRTTERDEDLKQQLQQFEKKHSKIVQNLTEHTKYKDEQLEFLINEKYNLNQKNLDTAIEQVEEKVIQATEATFSRSQKDTVEKLKQLEKSLQDEFNQQIITESVLTTKKLNEIEDKIHYKIDDNVDKIHQQQREIQDEMNDRYEQALNQLNKDKEDLRKFKSEHQSDIRKTKEELNDNIFKSKQEINKSTDEKMTNESKRVDSNLARVESDTQRKYQGLKIQVKEDMQKQKEDLIAKFKKELDEIVLKKVLALIQTEKKERIARDQEIENNVQNIKNMLLETIQQKVESAKSLARALFNEEAAERSKAIEELLKYTKESIETLDKTLRKLITISIEECKQELRKEIKALEEDLMDFKTYSLKEFQKLHDTDEQNYIELQNEFYLRDQYVQLRQEELNTLVKNMEAEIFHIKNTREKDLIEFVKEVALRDKQSEEIKSKFDAHDSNFLIQQNLIETQRNDHENLKKELVRNIKRIDRDISETREILNMYQKQVEKKMLEIKDKMEDDFNHFESQSYADKVLNQMKFQEVKQIVQESTSRINEIAVRVQDVEKEIKELDDLQAQFENSTVTNFKTAEKQLKAHTEFLNRLDSRITTEELLNQACFNEQNAKLIEVHKEFTDRDQLQTAQTAAMLAAAQQENLNNLVLLKQETDQAQQQLTDNLNQKLDLFQEETDQKFDNLKQFTEQEVQKFFDAKDVQEQELIANQEKLMDELRQEQQQKIDKIQDEQNEQKIEQGKNLEQLMILTTLVETNKTEQDQKLDQQKEELDDKIQKLQIKADEDIQQLEQKNQEQLQDQQKQTEDQLQFFREKQEEFDDKVRAQFEEQKNENQENLKQIETKLDENKEELEKKLKDQEDKTQEQVNDIKQSIQEKEQQNEEKLNKLDEKLEDKVTEIELAQNGLKQVQDQELQKQTDLLQQKIDDLDKKQNEKVDDLQKTLEDKLNDQTDAIRQVEVDLTEEMQKLKDNNNEQILLIQQNQKDTIQDLQQELKENEENNKQEIQEMLDKQKNELENLKIHQQQDKEQGSAELENIVQQFKNENQKEHQQMLEKINKNEEKIQDLDKQLEQQEQMTQEQAAIDKQELQKKLDQLKEEQEEKNQENIKNQLQTLKQIEGLQKESDDTKERVQALEKNAETQEEEIKNKFVAVDNHINTTKRELRDNIRVNQEETTKQVQDLEQLHEDKIGANRTDFLKLNKELTKDVKANKKDLEDKLYEQKSLQKEVNEKLQKEIEDFKFKIEKNDFYVKDTYSKTEETTKKAERLTDDYLTMFKKVEGLEKNIEKIKKKQDED